MDKQAYFKMMGLDKQAAIDPQVLKNILLGTGAGLGTYALSSFLPGARQNRLARLLASLGVGLGTGYFGTDIRNWFSNRSGKKQDTNDPTIEQQTPAAPDAETPATKAATPPPASKTPATKAATPPPASKTPATKAATPPAASKTPATKAAIPPAATTKDPYQAELDQRVAENMRDVQLKLAENPIRYMNANPVKIRQAIYKWHRAGRDAWNANRGYPYKINPHLIRQKGPSFGFLS